MATKRGIVNLREVLGLSDRNRMARARRIGLALWREWRALSASLPPRFRVPYNAAMDMDVTPRTVKLVLGGDTLVRSVEYGFGAGGVGTRGSYDMRFTHLRAQTKSIRQSRSGFMYLNVPFRVTKRGMNAMAASSGAYRKASQLEASVRSNMGTAWGGRLSNPSQLAQKLKPHHATDPLAGLYKHKKPGDKKATYGTFRRMSFGPNGKPWMHPGIPAHRLMRKVADQVQRIVSEVG